MYCRDCGQHLPDDANYCDRCGAELDRSETDAETDPDPDPATDTGIEHTEPVENAVRLQHQCQRCGEMLNSGEPPCPHCGSMHINSEEVDPKTAPASPTRASSEETTRNTQFYIGAVVAGACVIIFPYFLVFVAIPEAIAGLFGTSIQDKLGKDARDNPFLSGSFLITRWFGNFLFLLFFLGLIVGFFAL